MMVGVGKVQARWSSWSQHFGNLQGLVGLLWLQWTSLASGSSLCVRLPPLLTDVQGFEAHGQLYLRSSAVSAPNSAGMHPPLSLP
mmetsp:Transcript_28471/g.76835  ORF Transcript_28471/g.76835 Transcript_28471/m.76835 type:complete len:85 (+) Transcript_28471:394-648(+)